MLTVAQTDTSDFYNIYYALQHYTLSKNATNLSCYNSDIHESIEKVGNQKIVYFSASPN